MAASRTLMALAIAATLVVELAMAANYTVGDSDGWEIGTDVQSWAASKNFTVGDVISFVYSANHDVVEVKEVDFGSCSGSNPIEKHTGGNTAITLSTAGKRFFICGVPGHCTAGMKVQIDTLAASSPPPSSTDAPPSPPPHATPSSPPPASPPPSSKDAPPTPPPIVAPSSPPPASPPKSATKPPTKSPLAPSPGSNASPPAPPFKPTPPSSAPTPEPPIPPFPFDQPLIPSAAPTTPPPPPSSAYKCSFMVHFSVGFSFVAIILLAL
ncbi:blue copper protein-like isoform X1 [Cucurbita moschata]|uniref:Blue copper protein-like isoform X1 n=1 Tax=Cucurbita moschata TaxID=3662 RepID=A0A6J1G8Q5_CUCMO|nr:blue copper protein-like isoform X1 [Cucurbita moschata]